MNKETIRATDTGIEIVKEVVQTTRYSEPEVERYYNEAQQALDTLISQNQEAMERLTKNRDMWSERRSKLTKYAEAVPADEAVADEEVVNP